MSYRDDAVDLIANQIEKEKGVALAKPPNKKTKREPQIEVSPEDVSQIMEEIETTLEEEGDGDNGNS